VWTGWTCSFASYEPANNVGRGPWCAAGLARFYGLVGHSQPQSVQFLRRYTRTQGFQRISTKSLVASLTGHSGFRCDTFGPQQLRCGSEHVPEIWWLTRSGHPAHPAVSRGLMLLGTTGETCLVRDGYYAGTEAPFAAWMKELKNFDELTVKRLKASQK